NTAAAARPAKQTMPLPALPEAHTYVLKGGTVHHPGKPAFAGTIVVTGRKIAQVIPANEKQNLPADAKVVDVAGLHLYPGLIAAGTVLGLIEIDALRETNDARDGGDFQPDLRASIGINPDSEILPVTRSNGVTTVVTRPTGSLMPGQGAVINLAGWVPAEMV